MPSQSMEMPTSIPMEMQNEFNSNNLNNHSNLKKNQSSVNGKTIIMQGVVILSVTSVIAFAFGSTSATSNNSSVSCFYFKYIQLKQ